MSFEGCVIISGTLQKCKLTNIKYFLGTIQTGINFKKRYFELTSNLLSYYSDASSGVLKGNIPVPYITYVEQLDPEAIGSKYTLQVGGCRHSVELFKRYVTLITGLPWEWESVGISIWNGMGMTKYMGIPTCRFSCGFLFFSVGFPWVSVSIPA